jgi:hypothetical protein
MKKLPVGIQTFRKLIEGGYVYADKTGYVYDLIQNGSYYFLSRPRRFGKSLLIDTIAEAFSGDRELFEGLAIANTDFPFERHPIIRLDMTQVSIDDTQSLARDLGVVIGTMEETEGFKSPEGSIALRLQKLIESLRAKYNQRVVVLVDEYDKPVIDHISEPEKARANRELLGNFYGVLKGQDANLRFVMLTGVSKFAKLSLFSKLNNLADITLRNPYVGICGFTEAEFDGLFTGYIAAYREAMHTLGAPDGSKELNQIRHDIFDWYDGFSWDGVTRVFNPFSLLCFFKDFEYNPYWFSTGTPTFLVEHFRNRPGDYAAIQEAEVTERILDSHDIENAPLVSLLFQTGFLTVHKKDRFARPPVFSLGFPNVEVGQSISELFLSSLESADIAADPYSLDYIQAMTTALDSGNPEALAEPLSGLYASIPYQLHIEAEAYYHSVFLAVMQFLGFRVLGEVSVAKGRTDGVLDRPNGMSYVVEFKHVTKEAELDDALDEAAAQIEARGYAQRYQGSGRKVFKVAIAVAGRGEVRVRAL